MARFFAFFTLFHLSLTFFRPEVPFKYKDEIWIKAVAVATILKYKNTMKSIRNHVDPKGKRKLSELRSKSKQNESFWLKMASESRGSETDLPSL